MRFVFRERKLHAVKHRLAKRVALINHCHLAHIYVPEFVDLGLVDEYRLYFLPIVLGGGTPFFPSLRRRLRLRLVEKAHTFADGVVRLRYQPS